jgi:acetyl esterase/lipase
MSQIRSAGMLDVAPLIGRMGCSPLHISTYVVTDMSIVIAALTCVTAYPFRSVRCTAFYNDVLYTAVRCMLERITIPQSRYLNASTSARYIAYCKRRSITPDTITVSACDDSKVDAHWLGASEADAVILYLHGGGYTQSANEGNLQYMTRLVKDLNGEEASSSVAVLILAYTLAPEARHPAQLREAAAVLSYLITKTGRKPSNIFVSGDSAGGNLALVLLSHLLHPHPEVAAVKLEEPLGGALLYSPWAGFSTDYPSYDNVELDMLSPLALRKWSAMFLDKANPTDPELDPGAVSGDAYTEACKNPSSWWKGIHRIVSDVFVSYGGYEVLADPIKELETHLKEGWVEGSGDLSRVMFVGAPKEAHIQPIIDAMMPGAKAKSSTQVAIEKWYAARLRK